MPGQREAGFCHEPIISLHNIHFAYNQKKVLDNLNFTVLERDFVGLTGHNGAGKTTLLRMIVGLHRPTEGDIQLFGQPIQKFKQWERIGYVPQRNAINPLFPATVKEVVLSGLYGRKKLFRKLRKADLERCEEALTAMGIDNLSDRLIGKLSGGQQQRVLLARALVNNPDLLILDEPTVGIDAETQEGFFHLIQHMHQRHRITFLMVSHDLDMMHSYLGTEPKSESGGLRFYVRHTHELDDCAETDLSHPLKELQYN